MNSKRKQQLWLATAVLGLLLAIVGALRSSSSLVAPGEDVAASINGTPITATQLAALAKGFAGETGQASREATAAVLETLIDQELLYQAGVRAGFLANDPIIRRRVIQLELDQLSASVPDPGDDDLAAYYEQNLARYTSEPQVQFRQIFFPSRGEDDVAAVQEAVRLRDQIRSERDFATLEKSWVDKLRAHDAELYYPQGRLTALYGQRFARLLLDSPLGKAAGPFPSSLGMHVVWLRDLRPAAVSAFAAVRPQVEQDWRQAERTRLTRDYVKRLRDSADVKVFADRELLLPDD